MSTLTVEQFQQALPSQYKNSVNQLLIDNINTILNDPNCYETYRDNLLGYAHIMRDGKFKMKDYIFAVKYCSHKIMGNSNIDAFVKTFPQRYQGWLNQNLSQKDIASYISSYNKNKLVNLILEQSLIPSWVLNQDLYQKAINTQAELMMTAQSEKVRSDAANSLMTHLKPPETTKVELDIGLKEDAGLNALKQTLLDLSMKQQQMIKSGVMNAKQVAEQKLVGQVIEHV